MTRISNFSAIGLVRDSSEILVSLASLFFLSLPLIRGIHFWGDKDYTILPSCAVPSTSSYAQCDVIIPVGKGKFPFLSLRMPVVSENESQPLWGSGMVIMPLRVPFFRS